MRWCYKAVHFSLRKEGLLGSAFLDEEEVEKSLNELGMAGWELVSMMDVNDGVVAVLKQPLGKMRGSSASLSVRKKSVSQPTKVVASTSGEGVSSQAEKRNIREVDSRCEKECEDVGTICIE